VQQEMALQEIVGCAVGVVRNGVIVHVKGYGYLDIEQTKPVTENTIFRWASISKPITAVAALKAIEDGKLKFSDKVKDKVSYWPTDGNKGNITVEHLLNNRGGIAQYSEGGNCNYKTSNYTAKNSFNAQQSVNVFKDCSLVNTPGSAYNYSSFGFNLLGAVVEEATDVPYVDYVQKHIANVAGMSNLKAYANDPGGFDKNCSNELKKVTEGNVEYKLPGGGWSSGIYDLTRFMQGLITGKFLKNTSALWKPVANNNGYGFGVMYNTRFNKTQVFHGGTHDDVRTFMGFFPSDKNGVCVIINGGKYVDRVRLYQKIQNASGYTWSESPLSLDFNDGKTTCGDRMMSVWRKTNKTDVILRNGYTKDNFYKAWSDLIKLGYHCSDFETYMEGSSRKWSGTFKKGASGSAMWRDFDYNGFKTKWDEMNGKGYRLIDIETYVDGSSRKWAGLFIKGSGPYALYRGLNTNDFGTQNKNVSSKGYKLVDIEAYTENNVLKWAGVWQGSGSYLLNRNYDTTPFTDLRSQRNSSGYKLVNVESYMVGSTRKWAGIWEKSSATELFQFNTQCGRFIASHNSYKETGYELIDLEKY
jgi:CubicO group peptidase (beta-lactamase class C family)